MIQEPSKCHFPFTGAVNITFGFHDLPVSQEMIETMMGYNEEHAPEPIPGIIQEVLNEAAGFSDIRGGYTMVSDIRISDNKKNVLLGDKLLLTDKIIASSLREAETILIFLFTAGIQYEIRSRDLMLHDDQIKGYVVDTLGSIVVELAVDRLRQELEKQLAASSLKMTNPYSPGYCGWPVSDQSKLFSFFPDGFAGITLSKSSLMTPIKSVSGIIGAGEKAKKRAYRCEICDLTTCIYRNMLKPG
jgi:hypothetical protein